jgi:hypothetical protein
MFPIKGKKWEVLEIKTDEKSVVILFCKNITSYKVYKI